MSAEVKPGFKQTEVGVLPVDWEARKLGELASFRTGPFGSALHKSDYTNDGIPVVNPMHILDGRIVPTTSMTITEDAAKNLEEFRLKPGEVIIGRRGDMGRCAVVSERERGWLCGTGSMIVRPSVSADAYFLQRVLSSPSIIKAIEDSSVGSTMINLNQGTLSNLVVQAPKVEEQRAVAATLSDMDTLISSLDQEIAQKRDIQQAAMQQLLTGQRRLPGFSGKWEVKKLGDIASLNRINVIPFTTPDKTFTHFSLPAFDEGKRPVKELGVEIGSNKFSVPANAILVSKLNPRIPRVWLPQDIPDNAVASTEFLVLTPRDGIAREFLYVVCRSSSFCAQMELAATGTTGSHQRISPGSALSLSVSVPSEKFEQSAIATILFDMDTEIASLESRLEKTRQLKQGMMQELLTGRIRLV
ncbi:MAG: restriction endonuclease subunit S [Pseudomonas sp.]|nr:restriction endonuclease subunit S [Pseudomonas sp.]